MGKSHKFKVGDIVVIKDKKNLKKNLLYLLGNDSYNPYHYWDIMNYNRFKIKIIDNKCKAYINSKYCDCVILECPLTGIQLIDHYYPIDIFETELNKKINKLLKL